MDDYTLDQGRFEALAGRPRRVAARLSATAASLLGHAALLAVALYVVRPPRPLPPPPPDRELLVVRPPRFALPKPVEAPVWAPVQPAAVSAAAPAPPPAPAPVPIATPAPAPVAPAPAPAPARKPAPHPKVAARTPPPRVREPESEPLPPQIGERSAALLRSARLEAALRDAAERAGDHSGAAAAADGPAEPAPTPAEERRAFAQSLAARVRTRWVLPEGSPRASVLVALTVRLLGAGYRLDCRPGPGAAGETAQMACAAIAAADLPQLPQSLAHDGTQLAARFEP